VRAIKLENSGRQQGTYGVAAKHAKEEDGDAPRKLALRVPVTQGVCAAGDVSRLCEAEHAAHC